MAVDAIERGCDSRRTTTPPAARRSARWPALGHGRRLGFDRALEDAEMQQRHAAICRAAAAAAWAREDSRLHRRNSRPAICRRGGPPRCASSAAKNACGVRRRKHLLWRAKQQRRGRRGRRGTARRAACRGHAARAVLRAGPASAPQIGSRGGATGQSSASSSSIRPLITPRPICQKAGSEASRPKGASSSEWCLVPPAFSMSKYFS